MSFERTMVDFGGEDGVATITLNRPENANMFNETMCHEIRDCINDMRRETRTRVHGRYLCSGIRTIKKRNH